ncbi:MAG: NADH-quinone oxidoreductase subunit NuoH [Alphaproteobacteria bacterium]
MFDTIIILLLQIGKIIAVVLPLFIAVGFMTWAERRVIAWAQRRQGPNVVGPFGLLQWVADAVKLIFKETILPSGSNRIVFLIAPMLTMALAVVAWAVMPIDPNFYIADINVGILYLFAISSLGVYGIIMAGWASNSKYPFLGALRSAAQMVSYEVSLGLVIITVVIVAAAFGDDGFGTFSLLGLVEAQRSVWFFIPLFPMFIVFFISALAETNRTPFDLPEGESELVAGYFVEYSSMAFALFFLGEYANILLMSAMTATLFFGGYLAVPGLGWLIPDSFVWFLLKTFFFAFVFIWIRATVPRYRYDQLMRLGWKVFLPFSVVAVVFYAAMVMIFSG